MDKDRAPSAPFYALIVEDNTGMSDLLKCIFKLRGCATSVCRSAEAALDSIKRIRPDLVCCDIKLWGSKSGLDLARAIRSDSELAHIPLLALSGFDSEEQRKAAMDAGFDYFFSKPFKFAELTTVLDLYIASHQQESTGQFLDTRGDETKRGGRGYFGYP